MDKRLRLFLVLATAAIVFVIAGSIFNWIVNDQGEGICQEIYVRGDVGLFLVVPLFLVSFFPAIRGSYRAILVILGLLSYPILVMYRETGFADKHIFIILFVISASCALYAIIIGSTIVRNRAPALPETHDRLAKGIVSYFVYFMLLYVSAFVLCISSIGYPIVKYNGEIGRLVYQFAFLHLFVADFFIITGILFPFLIYTIILFLKKCSHGLILAPVLIISSMMVPLSVLTYRDFDSFIWLIVVSSCTLFSILLIVAILWVLPKGDVKKRHGYGTKY